MERVILPGEEYHEPLGLADVLMSFIDGFKYLTGQRGVAVDDLQNGSSMVTEWVQLWNDQDNFSVRSYIG